MNRTDLATLAAPVNHATNITTLIESLVLQADRCYPPSPPFTEPSPWPNNNLRTAGDMMRPLITSEWRNPFLSNLIDPSIGGLSVPDPYGEECAELHRRLLQMDECEYFPVSDFKNKSARELIGTMRDEFLHGKNPAMVDMYRPNLTPTELYSLAVPHHVWKTWVWAGGRHRYYYSGGGTSLVLAICNLVLGHRSANNEDAAQAVLRATSAHLSLVSGE